MITILENVKVMYQYFCGTGAQLLLFATCIFLLFIQIKDKEKQIEKFLVTYVLIFCGIYACPVTAGIIMRFCVDEDVYWRMFWILPIAIVLAYTGTKLISSISQGKIFKKLVAVVMSVLLIALAGNSVFHLLNNDVDLGKTKLPLEIEGICVAVKEDAKIRMEEEVKVIVPDEFVCYIRQYDGTIKMPYGRRVGNRNQKLHDLMNNSSLNAKGLLKRVRKRNCNYMVYNITDYPKADKKLKRQELELIATIGKYGVYYIPEDNK